MKYFFLVVFILMVRIGIGQQKSELPFIEHLINKGYFDEVIRLTDRYSLFQKQGEQDSINYYRGWAHYSLKNLDQSTLSLLNVGKGSPFYMKSRFFAGYNQIFLGNYVEARNIISKLNVKDEPNLSLVNFELSGIDLLQGSWPQAKEHLQQVNANVATINQQVLALGQINQELESHRPKSPLLAGVMSCIIPGSGKIYAGKTGAGIASMIANIGFGLITWENYRKLGIVNVKTIFFGSIFAANYVSNIYGSVVSVRVIENEYKDAKHNQILFQLHIPLRNFFEQ
jgi:TM2 domain-containing membrane protein YozV